MPPGLRTFQSIARKGFSSPQCVATIPRPRLPIFPRILRRHITADEKPLFKAEKPGPGPNQNQLPHVSEEAAATAEITGDTGPDLDQGTPIQEVPLRITVLPYTVFGLMADGTDIETRRECPRKGASGHERGSQSI